MTRAQRIVLIVYCLLVFYCCLWLPWHVVRNPSVELPHQFRTGYGWLWIGPSSTNGGIYSTPDLSITGLRLLAATAISGAAFLLAGMLRSQQP